MSEPILRWAGSKKRLLPILRRATPAKFKRYVEPFVGSAVNFLELPKHDAVLADLNSEIIHAYEMVRRFPKAVWQRTAALPKTQAQYYKLRSLHPDTLGRFDRAVRFIYLNRFCFNGVYRTNREGHFNVSRGKGHLFVPPLERFLEFSERLQQCELVCEDFEKVVGLAKRGDYAYLDPPYAERGKRDRGEYGIGTFRENDEKRLVEVLKCADERGVKILLSYTNSPVINRELAGWHFKHIQVQRNVAGFTGARNKVSEVLVSNYRWE